MITRRLFVTGLSALVCSPAIVRASSLMPIKAPELILEAGDQLWLGQAGVGLINAILPSDVSQRDKLSIWHTENLNPASVDLFVTRRGTKMKLPAELFISEIKGHELTYERLENPYIGQRGECIYV